MFYEKITELSAKKGMSVARMAQELGLSNATATKWRHGAKPYYNTLIKIARYFDVDVEYLVDDDYDDYDEWLSEVKGMTRVQYLGTINEQDKKTAPTEDARNKVSARLLKREHTFLCSSNNEQTHALLQTTGKSTPQARC